MKAKYAIAGVITAAALLFFYSLFAVPPVSDLTLSDSPEVIARGEYLVNAGGCVSCHEGSESSSGLSGGLALESDFGTFYVPNITPHMETGIGAWSAKDFLLAMKHGRAPGGGFYFPAFPYRSYAGMTDEDVLAVASWLMAQPPVESITPEAETPWWLSRWMLSGWNWIADLRTVEPVPNSDSVVQRGAYLARNLGHCGECHTPRDAFGIPDGHREFGGGQLSDGSVEAIDAEALQGWTEEDFAFFLFLGLKPDGEYVGGEMEPVIEHNTSRLTEEDRQALAAFFKRG